VTDDAATFGTQHRVSADAHPAPDRHRVTPSALWFGLLGAPAAWSVQTLVDLPVSAHACFPRIFPLAAPATGALRGILFVVSLAAIIVSVAALRAAVLGWQATREEHQSGTGKGGRHDRGTALAETGEGRTRFMAAAGVLASLTFLFVNLAQTAVVFLVVPPCGG
jgi:hypothetical protein